MATFHNLTSASSYKKILNYLAEYKKYYQYALALHKSLPEEDIKDNPLPESYIQKVYEHPLRKKFYTDSIMYMMSMIPYRSRREKIMPRIVTPCPSLEIPRNRIMLSPDGKTITCKYGKIVSNLRFDIGKTNRIFLETHPDTQITRLVIFS